MLTNDNTAEIDLYSDVANPLDGVEEIMMNNDWVFDRPFDDQLTVQVTGKMGTYDMVFLWQEEYSALQFLCMPDITFAKKHHDQAVQTTHQINQSLWMGHFDIEMVGGSCRPRFKHTCLFRGMVETSGVAVIEDLIDVALNEAERYHTAFDLIGRSNDFEGIAENDNMTLALMPTAGRS